MSEYNFLIDNMIWSFSRLNSFCICKYEWYLQYIEEAEGTNNFYAEFGKFCHKILEMYAKGELGLFELSDYFVEHYDEEVKEFVYHKTADIRENYKQKAIEYFDNIDIDFGKYEILGIEKKCDFEINGYKFTGYIDLLLREKDTGKIVLIDHKSSKYPYGKKGKLLKSEKDKFQQYKRQLYLYSIQVFNEYGVFPDRIGWNYFGDRKWDFLDFNKEDYEEAKKWAIDTLEEVRNISEFPPTVDFYYCHNLCKFRNSYCEYKNY